MLAGVIRTIKTAFLRLDDCIDAIRICAGNGNTDLAKNSFWEAVAFEMFPGNAVIFGTIEAAARSAAGEKPRLPARLPERRENDIRVMRIEDNINPASVLVFR